MPGVPMYIRVQLRTLHLWYGRTRTIGAPQHDTKHTMDTSCGTPWNTSTMDVPRERSIHISRVAPPVVHGTSLQFLLCLSLPLTRLYYFSSFLFNVLSFLAILLYPHPPCYQVQGQPIEGNFLPIASACPPRTILLMVLFFIPARCSFFLYVIYSLFSSISLISWKRSANSRTTRRLEGKHRWKLVRDAFGYRRTG